MKLMVQIVTFDEGGVSGHPNHISCFQGARSVLISSQQFSYIAHIVIVKEHS